MCRQTQKVLLSQRQLSAFEWGWEVDHTPQQAAFPAAAWPEYNRYSILHKLIIKLKVSQLGYS